MVISGTLVGSIVASESVRLLASARVVGDLAAPRVIMDAGAAYRGRVDMGDIEAARAAVASRSVAQPVATSASAAKDRPAPPRVAPTPKTAAFAAKVAPKFVAPAGIERSAPTAAAAPPAFPRVAGTVGSVAPAWAKKKIRRR